MSGLLSLGRGGGQKIGQLTSVNVSSLCCDAESLGNSAEEP